MKNIATGKTLGKQLCDKWGLKNVRSMTIEISFDNVVSVSVEKFIDEDEANGMVGLMTEHYVLAETAPVTLDDDEGGEPNPMTLAMGHVCREYVRMPDEPLD